MPREHDLLAVLKDRVKRLGHDSLCSLMRAHPGEPVGKMLRLVAERIPEPPRLDVPYLAFEEAYLQEALRLGVAREVAQDLLVRSLREHLGRGWARGMRLKERLEQVLTEARLPVILDHAEQGQKTLIYTHLSTGIDQVLKDALEAKGLKVGLYTGEEKAGLKGFIEGDLDVLIGSSSIGTGVDGLQQVCSRLIINVLPWTNAEYEQLRGRIYRQGQKDHRVEVIIPVTHATVNGERWSWCKSKLQRLKYKKSIADAAVDGVVPEGHLRTPEQAYRDVMKWLERLDAGDVETIERERIVVPLPPPSDKAAKKRLASYGDFSKMNNRWNSTHSSKTHKRLQENREEWQQYHTLYREARESWEVVPYELVIEWCEKRSGYVIGDFGCGEAKVAEALAGQRTVHSFDHVAVNATVIECDFSKVPLEDEELDMAVFSLSLMGSNLTDYILEARRTLRLDGHLHIIDRISRFKDREVFLEQLRALGFDVASVEERWKFLHIRAQKTARSIVEGVGVGF